jgi:hypothetical protein
MHVDLLVIGLGYAGLPLAREASPVGLGVGGLGAGTVLAAASERAAIRGRRSVAVRDVLHCARRRFISPCRNRERIYEQGQ